MIYLVSADFQKLKSEMKQSCLSTSHNVKSLKKKYAKEKIPSDVQKKINELEHLKEMHSHSTILPVKVAGLIINYKLYQAFMKKLSGFEYRFNIEAHSLSITYWRNDGSAKGILSLDDLSKYFEGFKHIPLAELKRNAKTS